MPEHPYHAVLGGGDQLYNDNVMATKVMDDWLKLTKEERIKYQPTKEMIDTVEDYYLQAYLGHVHYHAAADFLRSCPQVCHQHMLAVKPRQHNINSSSLLHPGRQCTLTAKGSRSCYTTSCMQVNTWDDHDTFDGWGSYPEELQTCPVFSMVFAQSQRFYLLFQHATTPEHAADDGYIINPGKSDQEGAAFHFLSQLGPSLMVVAPDSRSQRSRQHILTQDSYKRIEAAVRSKPGLLQLRVAAKRHACSCSSCAFHRIDWCCDGSNCPVW